MWEKFVHLEEKREKPNMSNVGSLRLDGPVERIELDTPEKRRVIWSIGILDNARKYFFWLDRNRGRWNVSFTVVFCLRGVWRKRKRKHLTHLICNKVDAFKFNCNLTADETKEAVCRMFSSFLSPEDWKKLSCDFHQTTGNWLTTTGNSHFTYACSKTRGRGQNRLKTRMENNKEKEGKESEKRLKVERGNGELQSITTYNTKMAAKEKDPGVVKTFSPFFSFRPTKCIVHFLREDNDPMTTTTKNFYSFLPFLYCVPGSPSADRVDVSCLVKFNLYNSTSSRSWSFYATHANQPEIVCLIKTKEKREHRKKRRWESNSWRCQAPPGLVLRHSGESRRQLRRN